MSINSRGMSIQEAYRNYRDGKLIVNRQYQRKLVWSEEEKAKLIDSVLKQYPIPLILLASSSHGEQNLEIIDGMQRLNAIFGFIDNEFQYNGCVFDIEQFARAKQASQEGIFQAADPSVKRLSAAECANFLDYQLAITQFDADDPTHVVNVFGRINSGGRQLSDQERRQAGVINPFANLVRKLSSELRGDTSRDSLVLSEMPSISIDNPRAAQRYGLNAKDIFWCKQGIIPPKKLISSEDEEIVADLLASILLKKPLAISRELLDKLYDVESDIYKEIETKLTVYTANKLAVDVTRTFSVLRELITSYSGENNFLRDLMRPGHNPIKTPFYSLFMAFFELIVNQQLSPGVPESIFGALKNSGDRLVYNAHYAKSEDREKNVQIIQSFIEKHFIKQEPPIITHGPSLALDLENSIRRSKTESAAYEMKQGILDLGANREIDRDLLNRINQTICAIANLGPQSIGFLTIGVADKKSDADRINVLDKVACTEIAGRYVVGIDREAAILRKSIDEYVAIFIQSIRKSTIPDPLKTQVLSSIDVISLSGHTIIRIRIPPQKTPSYIDNLCYVRQSSNTVHLTDLGQIAAVTQLFQVVA